MTAKPEAPAVCADRLTKRYRRGPALREASFSVPQGAVAALVGANGAGKSTLLGIAAGLLRPSSGSLAILGDEVDERIHPRAAFLAQRRPLYDRFTVQENLDLGQALNERWNPEPAQRLLDQARVPLDARAGALSEGQRTRVCVALALAREPDVLLLDEPLAGLDPLARDDLHRTLMTDVAERGTTVLMSSHMLNDLHDICDHLVLLDEGRVRLAGEIEDLLAEHRVVIGPAADTSAIPPEAVVHQRRTERQATILMRGNDIRESRWESETPTLETLVLGYLRSHRGSVRADENGAVSPEENRPM